MIRVSEIYVAPQGEGPYLGRPSLFVRVHGCPLSCSFCDSSWTWNREHPGYANYTTVSVDDLAAVMLTVARDEPYAPYGLVLTGGEPLLYQAYLPAVIDSYRSFMAELEGIEVQVEIETSGVAVPSDKMLSRGCHFNVSHKFRSAGNEKVPRERLWSAVALEKFLRSDAIFKPVVSLQDRDELRDYIGWLSWTARKLGLPEDNVRSRVFLMPQAATRVELYGGQKAAIELAQEFGVGVTTRMQVVAFDNERKR